MRATPSPPAVTARSEATRRSSAMHAASAGSGSPRFARDDGGDVGGNGRATPSSRGAERRNPEAGM